MAEDQKASGFPARSYARMVAFQILYQEDTNPGSLSGYADDFIYNELHQLCGVAVPDDTPALERTGEPVNEELPSVRLFSVDDLALLVQFTKQLVANVQDNRERIDEAISAVSKNWDIARMGVPERNILRLATGEMLIGKHPKAVVINEALELAKKFSDRDSLAFINGVLDRVQLKPVAKAVAANIATNTGEETSDQESTEP